MQVTRVRGRELGYAEITTATVTTTSTTYVDLAGLATTVVVGSRPIVIVGWAAVATHSVDQGAITLGIFEGATELARQKNNVSGALGGSPVIVRRRLAPAAGTHTYKLRWLITTAGTGSIFADPTYPAHIHVLEV